MSARYQLRLKDTTGALVAVFDNYQRLSYVKQVNKPGYFALFFRGEDTRYDLFQLDYQLEVWRKNDRFNLDWHLDFEAFVRTPVRQLTSEGIRLFTVYGRGYMDLLQRRHILYDPNTSFVSKSGAGETVMKDYVEENAGASALVSAGPG